MQGGRAAGWTWAAALALLLALAALGRPAPVHAADEVAVKLVRIAGTVESVNAAATGGEWIAAYPGDALGPGWSLRTGPGSKALLVFPLENTVVLKENSYLTINAADADGGAQLESSDGGILVNIKNHLSGGAEFQVDTGAALAVVRGTKFGVFYRQGGRLNQPQDPRARRIKRRLRFYGFDGTVTLRNKFGEQPLQSGYSVDADEGLRLHRALKSTAEAMAFLKKLERTDEFEQFEKAHPDLADKLKEREAKRKAALERARQRREQQGQPGAKRSGMSGKAERRSGAGGHLGRKQGANSNQRKHKRRKQP
jgi:hypothetical protein